MGAEATTPKVGPPPNKLFNNFTGSDQGVREQPYMWQPMAVANFPTTSSDPTGPRIQPGGAISGDLIQDSATGDYYKFQSGSWSRIFTAGGDGAETVVALGSVIGDAATISESVVLVTGADGTKGVILPAGIGRKYHIINDEAAQDLDVYPPAAGTINGLGASNPFILLGGQILEVVFQAASTAHARMTGVPIGTPVQSTAQLTLAEANFLDGASAGTAVASKAIIAGPSNKDVVGLGSLSTSGEQINLRGIATVLTLQRWGLSTTEGTLIQVVDEIVTLTNAVKTDMTTPIPTGALVLSVQANLDTLIVGDGTGDDALAGVGIGDSGDPNLYGSTLALTQNQKVDLIQNPDVIPNDQISVFAVDGVGTAVTEKFVAGGEVRVRVVFLVADSLDDT